MAAAKTRNRVGFAPPSPADLVREYLRARDRGKSAYKKADVALTALLKELLKPPAADQPAKLHLDEPAKIDLGDGRTAVVSDNFAGGKLKCFKAAGVDRYAIEVETA